MKCYLDKNDEARDTFITDVCVREEEMVEENMMFILLLMLMEMLRIMLFIMMKMLKLLKINF